MMNSKPIFLTNKLLLWFNVVFLLLICTTQLSAQGKRVLFIGDSITDGNWGGGGAKASSERDHWDQNHLFGSGYMYLLAAYYMGHFPEYNLEFFNRGITGNTLDDLIVRWQADVIDLKPDVLSILIGTNDVAKFLESESRSFDVAAWSHKYDVLIDETKKKYPNVRIVLCTPFLYEGTRVKDHNRYVKLIDILADQVHKLAIHKQVTIVDFHALFVELKTDYPQVPSNYWLWDGIHPTVAAHQKMSELWREAVKEDIIF